QVDQRGPPRGDDGLVGGAEDHVARVRAAVEPARRTGGVAPTRSGDGVTVAAMTQKWGGDPAIDLPTPANAKTDARLSNKAATNAPANACQFLTTCQRLPTPKSACQRFLTRESGASFPNKTLANDLLTPANAHHRGLPTPPHTPRRVRSAKG